MDFRCIVVTGGAGFVGSRLALSLKEDYPSVRVVAFDNLSRHGSELIVPLLGNGGVEFRPGDIRRREDLAALPRFDLLIACAAEPAVTASLTAGPQSPLDTNLLGTMNSFETARCCDAAILMISTSRVYPLAGLNNLPFLEDETRFRWTPGRHGIGWSEKGISEEFPLLGPRSFYGASKLAAELIATEYGHQSNLPVLINRAGLLCGPWQMARSDQGVVTMWMARHMYRRPLTYIGFGGAGRQVRDVLDSGDFYRLIVAQLENVSRWNSRIYNVGGGVERSISLLELTAACQQITGWRSEVANQPETNLLDIRIYISDSTCARHDFNWAPHVALTDTLEGIERWIRDHQAELRSVLDR